MVLDTITFLIGIGLTISSNILDFNKFKVVNSDIEIGIQIRKLHRWASRSQNGPVVGRVPTRPWGACSNNQWWNRRDYKDRQWPLQMRQGLLESLGVIGSKVNTRPYFYWTLFWNHPISPVRFQSQPYFHWNLFCNYPIFFTVLNFKLLREKTTKSS